MWPTNFGSLAVLGRGLRLPAHRTPRTPLSFPPPSPTMWWWRVFIITTLVALLGQSVMGACTFNPSTLVPVSQHGPATTTQKIGVSFGWDTTPVGDSDGCDEDDYVWIVVDEVETLKVPAAASSTFLSVTVPNSNPGTWFDVELRFYEAGDARPDYTSQAYIRLSCAGGGQFVTASPPPGGGCLSCGNVCSDCYKVGNTFGDVCIPCTNGRINPNGASSNPDQCVCGPGKEGPTGDQFPCSQCALNKFQPSNSNGPCGLCPAPKITLQTGSTSSAQCLCPPGQHEDTFTPCALCGIGTYKPTPGNAAVCSVCPSGSTTTELGATACVCLPGYNGTHGDCQRCPDGSYSETANATACTPCPVGKTTPFGTIATSAADCSLCLPGFYGPNCDPCTCVGLSKCDDGAFGSGNCTCSGDLGEPTGYVLDTCSECIQRDFFGPDCNQTVDCDSSYGIKAPPGSGLEGSGFCGACVSPVFDFVASPLCDTCASPNQDLAQACLSCPGGWTSTPPESSNGVCQACNPGSFKVGEESETGCAPCPAGSASSTPALPTPCPLCLQGTYQPTPGLTSCLPCPTGTTTTGSGGVELSECLACPVSTYKATVGYDAERGTGACLPCPGNTTGIVEGATSIESCGCPAGQGLLVSTPPPPPAAAESNGDDTTCVMCPPGFVSPEFGRECSLCQPGTLYISPTQPCGPCPFGGLCDGGDSPPRAAPGFHPIPGTPIGFYEACTPPGVCVGGFQCREGHKGRRCGVCDTGWVKNPGNGLCEECPSYIVFVFVGVFTLGAIMLVALVRFAKKNSSMITSLAVGYNYIQIISVLSSYQITWPHWVQSFFDAMSAVNIDLQIIKPECLASDSSKAYVTIWAVKLASPWILLAMLVLMYGVVVVYTYAVCETAWFRTSTSWLARSLPTCHKEDLHSMRSAFINAGIMVAIVLYMLVTNTAMEIFPAEKTADGRNAMKREPAITYGSPQWNELLLGSLFSLFCFSLAFPGTIAFLLFRRRENLWKRKNLVRYGLLILRYKVRWYLYELLVLTRKFGMVFSKVVFQSNLTGQVVFSFCVILGAAVVQLMFHPFASIRINRLESLMLGFAVIVLFLAFWFAATGSDMSSGVSTAIGVLLIAVVVISILVLIVVIGLEIRRMRALRAHGVIGRYAVDSIDVWAPFFDLDLVLTEHRQECVDGMSSRVVLGFDSGSPVRLHSQVYLEKAFVKKTPLTRASVSRSLRGGTRVDPVYHQGVMADSTGKKHTLTFTLPRNGYYVFTLVVVDQATASGFEPPPPPSGSARLFSWVKRLLDGDGESKRVYTPEIVRAMMVEGGALAFRCRLAASPEWNVLDSMARNMDDKILARQNSGGGVEDGLGGGGGGGGEAELMTMEMMDFQDLEL